MPLLLFDIDGTLLTGLGPYESSLEQAIKETFKQEVKIDLTNYQGSTDRTVLRGHLEEAEIFNSTYEQPNREIDQCLKRFGEIYPAGSETQLIPGVQETIPQLKKQGHVLGLVTGNVEQMARRKLRMFSAKNEELNTYFKFGGFGEESYNRANLVLNAIQRAGNYDWDGEEAYVIGDTPNDIKAIISAAEALKRTIIPIGVTTGTTTKEQLQQARAQYVLDSLTELPDLIQPQQSL